MFVVPNAPEDKKPVSNPNEKCQVSNVVLKMVRSSSYGTKSQYQKRFSLRTTSPFVNATGLLKVGPS